MKSMHHMTESGVLGMEKSESDGIETFRPRFLTILTAREEEIENALDLLVDRQKDNKQSSEADFIEDFEQAEREITSNTYYTLLERKSRELKKIRFLINRIMKEEAFDLCEECGEKIPEERLLILPEATLCVPCQRELEKMDSRRKLMERTHNFLKGKKVLQWGKAEGYDDDVEFTIETDIEGLAFHELRETGYENDFAEENEIKSHRPSLEL